MFETTRVSTEHSFAWGEAKQSAPFPSMLEQPTLTLTPGTDVNNASLEGVYKSLAAVGEEIIRKLEEILGDELPAGLRSLAPEDWTPERTAERIVDGVRALFSAFARQNPGLEGRELFDAFLETVRGGIERGYEEARSMLSSVGALEFPGVSEGIEDTMRLVEEKLKLLREHLFAGHGARSSVSAPVVAEPPEPTAQIGKFVALG